jgi:hypothetical protein
MARQSKKSVYERIEDKKLSIKETEELLVTLNNELQELYNEKDDLEMRLLLAKVKENGLDIETALSKLCENSVIKSQSKETKKQKIEIVEE